MILGKLALTFGVPLGIPLWQLSSVRRLMRTGHQLREPASPRRLSIGETATGATR